MIQATEHIYIDFIPEKGRAVFAAKTFEPGEIIETCPVIILPNEDKLKIHETFLHDYYFDWGEQGEDCCIALGFGSMYNHSDTPNAEYMMFIEDQLLQISCQHKIMGGEEICISYIAHENQKDRLWF